MRKNYDTFSPAGKPSEQASKTASADGVLDDGTPLTSADVGSSSPRKRSGVGSASVEKRFDGDVEKRSDSGVIVDCNSVEESGAGADSFERIASSGAPQTLDRVKMRLSLSTDEEEDSKDANAPKESVYLNTFSRVGGDNEECGTENESEGESRPQQPQASDPSYDKAQLVVGGKSRPRHNPLHLIALGSCIVTQIFSVVVYIYFVNGDDDLQEALFGGNKSELFSLNRTLWIHPSYHGQNMWYMVQAFAFLWIIYGISTVFRKNPSTGDYLYCSPCVIPTATYAFWTASVLCFATLPFLVLRSYNVYCFTFVFLSASLTYCAIYNTATSIAKALPTLKKYKLNTDVLLAPGLSLGGPSSFAALGTYQCIVLICQLTIKDFQIVSEPVGCTIALVSISLIQVTMFITETWILDAYLRQMTGHYVFMSILMGFVHANPKVPDDSFFHNYNMAMIVVSALTFVLRSTIAIRRNHLDKRAEEEMHENKKHKREEPLKKSEVEGYNAFDNPVCASDD